MTARFLVGDVRARMAELDDGSVDFICCSPPFLALRSYLPDGHPDKALEIGSEQTPADYLDVLLALTAEWRRLLAPHGSIAIELGDTYTGSGGGGGDYYNDGLRAGQPGFTGSASASRDALREANARHWREKNAARDGWPLDKSLTGIPTLYTWSLAYGRNLLTGQPSPAGRWRVRNLRPWIRSNPPVGALGDKVRPATSYITVACVGAGRWHDLDAVRTPAQPYTRQSSVLVPGGEGGDFRSNGGIGRRAEMSNNAGGAPPLDWLVDTDTILDHELNRRDGKCNGGYNPVGSNMGHVDRLGSGDGTNNDGKGRATEGDRSMGAQGKHLRRALQAAGILPTGPEADYYDISPRGYSGMTRPTTRLVPCGPHDGGLRTTSRGCPTHGDRPAPAPTAPDDEHAETPATHTPHNGDRPVQGQPTGSVPTGLHAGQLTAPPNSDLLPLPCALAATRHNTASNRTGPAPATNPAGTPSGRSSDRTPHTSESPPSDGLRLDTPSSRTGGDDPLSPESETLARTADTSDPLTACTCTYHLAIHDSESTSHYAVWPPGLVKLLVAEMCPKYVCTECRRAVPPGQTRCPCGGSLRPGLVLDPFAGSGTTGMVTSGMARDCLMIDLDERNADLARERVGMFLEVDYPDREAAS